MTNAEIIEFLSKELIENYIWGERSDNPCEFYHYKKDNCNKNCKRCLVEYLENKNAKPTLTEDERVILRNIDKKFKYISRQYDDLRISYKPVGEEGELFYEFNHLFQFIKNGEEYSIEKLLKGE